MGALLAAFLKTGSGTFLSLLCGAVTAKVLAITLGPAGVGLFSVLRHSQQTAVALATVNGEIALTQAIPATGERQFRPYLATVLVMFAVTAGTAALLFVLAAPWLAALFSLPSGSARLFRLMAIPVALGIGMSFAIGVLNGMRHIGRLAKLQVVASAVTAAAAYPLLVVTDGSPVALVSLISLGTLAGAAFGAFHLWRQGALRWAPQEFRFDRQLARGFLRLGGATLGAHLIGGVAVLVVRALMAQVLGLEGVGFFDVGWVLGITYMMLVLSSFGTYYLPTLAGARPNARSLLMSQVALLTTSVMIPLLLCLIVLKPLVIQLLYSSAFLPAAELLRWILLANYLKAASWVLLMPMLALAQLRPLVWSELLFHGAWVAGSVALLAHIPALEAPGMALLGCYGAYLVFACWYAWRRCGFLPERRLAAAWLAGLALLVGASLATWDSVAVHWPSALLWLTGGLAISAMLAGVALRTEQEPAGEAEASAGGR